jgi:hypothetical protein
MQIILKKHLKETGDKKTGRTTKTGNRKMNFLCKDVENVVMVVRAS